MVIPNLPPHVPILGQAQQQAQHGILQAMQSLSLGIYSRLAVAYIGEREEGQPADREALKRLARDSQAAAQAFFEGIGAAQFPPGPNNGPSV